MGKRLDVRSMDGHHRIKKMGEMNPERFSCELEVLTRGVECPRPPGFCQKEGRFIGSEVHPLQDDAFNRLVVDGECVIPYKLSRDYGPAQGGRETRQSVIPA